MPDEISADERKAVVEALAGEPYGFKAEGRPWYALDCAGDRLILVLNGDRSCDPASVMQGKVLFGLAVRGGQNAGAIEYMVIAIPSRDRYGKVDIRVVGPNGADAYSGSGHGDSDKIAFELVPLQQSRAPIAGVVDHDGVTFSSPVVAAAVPR